jgi:hypothetical protein
MEAAGHAGGRELVERRTVVQHVERGIGQVTALHEHGAERRRRSGAHGVAHLRGRGHPAAGEGLGLGQVGRDERRERHQPPPDDVDCGRFGERLAPVATSTGSTTIGAATPAESRSATASTTAARPSIPVLIARTSRSSSTASSCCPTNAGETSSTARTPHVFWAVSARHDRRP